MRTINDKQSGLAAIETALVLPLLVLVLYCLLEGGLMLKTYARMSGAGREAARLVVRQGSGQGAETLVRNLTSDLDQTNLSASVNIDPGDSSVTVEVSYAYESLFGNLDAFGRNNGDGLSITARSSMPMP